jgi:predicted anti-sigma-YlaC factor YlaD
MNPPKCREPRALSEHLLTCPDCRAHARVATAWRDLPRFERTEPPVEPSDAFLSRTLAAIREDRARRVRRRLALAAAAALLFFFCVGTGHESAGTARSRGVVPRRSRPTRSPTSSRTDEVRPVPGSR